MTLGRSNILLVQLGFVGLAAVHFCTLSFFPSLHVDEPWLGERTLSWISGWQIAAPSFPLMFHGFSGITPLFTVLHSLGIHFFGFNLFGLRFISLAAFLLSLPLWYTFFKKCLSQRIAALFVVLYSVDVLTYRASHLGRPESLILFVMALALNVIFLERFSDRLRAIFAGALSTSAILIAPAGILVPFVVGGIFLRTTQIKKRSIRSFLLWYTMGCCASLGLFFSLVTYQDFSWAFFGPLARADLNRNVFSFPLMVLDITWRSPFKYRFFAILAYLVLMVVGGIRSCRKNEFAVSSYSLILFGFFITFALLCVIGRASNLYVVYCSPWVACLLASGIFYFFERALYRRALIFGMAAVQIVMLGIMIWTNSGSSSQDYAESLKRLVPPGSRVLASISNKLFFQNDYTFYALEDLLYWQQLHGTVDMPKYLEDYNIDSALLDCNADSLAESGSMHVCQAMRDCCQLVAEIPNPFQKRNLPLSKGKPTSFIQVFSTRARSNSR